MNEEYVIDPPPEVADGSEEDGRRPRRAHLLRGLWRPLVVLLAIAAVILVARPAQWLDELDMLRDWIEARGVWALAVILVLYTLAAVALVPQTVLKIAAGGLFGSWLGVAMASVGSTLGAVACFLLARYAARGPLIRRLKEGPRLRRLDRMSREHGTLLVVVSRLLPIFPGNLLNYALGLTQLKLATFTLWSWLCMLPGIVVLVVGTDAVLRGMAEGRVPWGLVGVVAAMLALMVAAIAAVRVRFRQEEDELAEL